MVVLSAPASVASSGLPAARRTGWRRFLLPVTYAYVAALVAVTVWLSTMNDTTETRFVLHVSTNLHNLVRGHYGTLFSSAFVIGDTEVALLIIPLLLSLLALAELRFGAWQVIRIFLAGHIGATLLVALGLWVAVEAGWLPMAVTRAEDVGISYGALALIGAFYAVLPARWRPTWAITWLAVAVAGVVMGRTFTNVGHLLAVAIGLAAGFWALRIGRFALPKLTRYETGLLIVAAALGYLLLVG
ncbi:hypothetical protein NDR87_32365 [Nocardia sp. CDC159]|uniref:Uncharacterized protein n=1 Tax=Nocardia pulmonis TaxID=2951408 RepID=A0A9X2EG16_9NOCA|nr:MULTISPECIES: rhomboid-like protein [Nocardia]MCM6778188.1 hypothetical protein [Nocardia pulmonis]MCM6791077.1 hypothetical protein [Nocardia sp. CDC159]